MEVKTVDENDNPVTKYIPVNYHWEFFNTIYKID
jgi:hypothetical protein